MSEKGVQVIDRVFDILELLAVESRGLGVTEIAKRLELNKSTVHRILGGIMDRGYVEKTEDGIYRLGIQFVKLASERLSNIELTTEARPYLSELTNIIGQSSHLAILDGSDAVYIDKVEVVRNLRLYSQIGKRIPVYCSALGKSLLMDESDKVIIDTLNECTFVKMTDTTKMTPEEVLKEIRQSKSRGWTIDDEEHDVGIRCIAAPIYDYRGKITATISVAGPSTVISKERDEEIGSLVVKYARMISEKLGYFAR